MRPADTVELCQAVNELNARRMAAVQRRVHAFLGLLLAIAVGLALAFALIHLSTLCKGASLCMFAVLPTQRNWLQRLCWICSAGGCCASFATPSKTWYSSAKALIWPLGNANTCPASWPSRAPISTV